MRLAPIPLFYLPDLDAIDLYSMLSARTTHGEYRCLECSRLLAHILFRALSGFSKTQTLFGSDPSQFTHPEVQWIAQGNYRGKSRAQIHGTGYVVQSLAAALWSFATTDNFRDAVLTAANLGDDADTTAAITGQVAGAFYGKSAIPKDWLSKLAKRELIENLADSLTAIPAQKTHPSKPHKTAP
jgi:ADP-ribosyl-[dinitrogen reductase] hydrolase